MTINHPKTIEDFEEEARLLQAKLAAIEKKKLELIDVEGAIRADMQRVENQLSRFKKAQEKTPD